MEFLKIIKKIVIALFILSLLYSCKSTNMKSPAERENFVKQYLQNKYASEFELISIDRENAPGEKIRNYSAKFRSSSYDGREFYITFSGNDSLKINVDQFPIILLEQAFLENLNIDENEKFPVVFSLDDSFVSSDYLEGISDLDNAKAKLSSLENTSWNFYIYTIINEPEKNIKEIEGMVANLLSRAYKILPAKISANVYIYNDISLTKADIQPDMNKGIISRTPHKDKLYEEWSMGWNQSMLESYDNGFQTVVGKRKLIPHF